MSKFKGYTVEEYQQQMTELRHKYQDWRRESHGEKAGFFPVFSSKIRPYLKDVSGNAMRLYLYLGIHSNNETGEVIGTNYRIMEQFFDCKLRTLHNWLEELESAALIKRVQPKFKGTGYIFLLPYSTNTHLEWKNREKSAEQEKS